MPLAINELKVGVTIAIDNDVFIIVGVEHVKPGKGAAFARVKLKNLKLGTVIERTYKSDDKIQDAYIEEKSMRYSYGTGDLYHFIDEDTYEDLAVEKKRIGEQVKFLKDDLVVSIYFYNNEIVSISLPNFVVYKITHSEQGIKGDTAKSASKPATLETGTIVQVPLFVNEGDSIKVDTRTGDYIERA